MIDLQLPMTFISFLMLICTGILTFSVVVFNLPVLIFVLIGLLVIYNGIRKYYIPCSRELKRLLSVASSPKMAHFQESIVGVDTIKAYSQEERFTKKNMQNVDNITKIQYILFACNRWLSIRLQSVSAVFVYSVSLFCLFGIGKSGQISPSLLGLIMNYSLSISTILFSIIRSWAGIETDSVAIERIAEYSNLTPEEPAGDKILVPKDWPANGEIKFIEYSTRYAEHLDNVLHEINVHIRGNEHIGIVGRTGAGKSSLTMALFRIIESTSGRIEIDGIDISKILLSDLRSKLSIIPQDSQTIKGSVRENLDPFNEYSDEKLWEVLELSHLKDHIKSMKTDPSEKSKLNVTTTETDEEREETNDAPGTKYALDAIIEDGGSNLSGGQKQLLCLARALLNQSKILLLDEATAAVDVQTDKIIQETIRKEFKDKTILIIAHRLETIIDSDRVLVLEHGKVEEFDKPDTLVKDSNGIFHLMCKESGHLTSDGKIKRI